MFWRLRSMSVFTRFLSVQLFLGPILCLTALLSPTSVSANQPRWQAPIVNYLRFESIVYQAAKRHDMEIALINAVIHTESYFNPKACSNKGACGLMQLIPKTATRYGVKDVFNPTQNINAGVRYLKDLLLRYNNDVTLALAAYNAGESAVDKYQGIPPFNETQEYVKKVLKHYKVYSRWP